jgi:glycosyltransferase involved in cell wall biosynthesis
VKKVWVDPDLLQNKSGIGRDAQFMVNWLFSNFDCEIVNWPNFINQKQKIRRKLLLAMRLALGSSFHLPNSYDGTFYQSQLGPLIPGSKMSIWVIRLHDLFPVTNPEWFRWWSSYIFRKSLDLAVSRKAIFLCDSLATENELKKLYSHAELNSFVIPCQLPKVELSKCEVCAACRSLKNIASEDFVLSVGTIEPRKNYAFAINAWKVAASKTIHFPKLIIVGRPGWKTRGLQKEISRASKVNVIWFSECCDGALEVLYENTAALISFSLAEGFDLPPMEARQRHQKPLLLSDISVHREFHNDDARFFRDFSELSLLLKSPLTATTISNYSSSSLKTLNEVAASLRSML